ALIDENRQLRETLMLAEARLNRMDAVAHQNERLKQLLDTQQFLGMHAQLARLIDVQLGPTRDRVMLNVGADEGVRVGQVGIYLPCESITPWPTRTPSSAPTFNITRSRVGPSCTSIKRASCACMPRNCCVSSSCLRRSFWCATASMRLSRASASINVSRNCRFSSINALRWANAVLASCTQSAGAAA